jgi:uncharacterized protein YndB with AHSA1/START domain
VTDDLPTRELALERRLDAPPERVWAAWTEPDLLARWWGPDAFDTPRETIAVDLRPGGRFDLTMVSRHDGVAYPSEMVFGDVVAPERLAYGWDAQTTGVADGEVVVTLAPADRGGTQLVQHNVGRISDGMLPLMEQGCNEQLDKLVALLATGRG